jgi:hypothetical protein
VVLRPGAVGYREGLDDLIPHVVVSTNESAAELLIVFDNGRALRVSLREEDSVDVEAVLLALDDPDRLDVWRPGDLIGR